MAENLDIFIFSITPRDKSKIQEKKIQLSEKLTVSGLKYMCVSAMVDQNLKDLNQAKDIHFILKDSIC
jgi:hypothetical protein